MCLNVERSKKCFREISSAIYSIGFQMSHASQPNKLQKLDPCKKTNPDHKYIFRKYNTRKVAFSKGFIQEEYQ